MKLLKELGINLNPQNIGKYAANFEAGVKLIRYLKDEKLCRYIKQTLYKQIRDFEHQGFFCLRSQMNICLLRLTSVEMIKNRKNLKLAGRYLQEDVSAKFFFA